jgi:xanthine dehydrogenase accessory factor
VTAVDPICGMSIVIAGDTPSVIRAGETIYFCCTGCKLRYEERDAGRARAV